MMADNHGKKPRVMVAGHLCLDITPVLPSALRGGNLLAPGKLIEVGKAEIHAGGAVSNTGLGLHILGTEVRLVAKVGKDEFGKLVQGIFERHQVEQCLIETDEAPTSYTLVLAPLGVDRTFLHHAGANHAFCSGDITDEMLEGIAHLHLGYPPMMERLYEKDGEDLVRLFCRAKERGISTSLDMAAVDPETPAGQVDWKRLLENTLPFVDFFVPSVEELCFMLDKARLEGWVSRAEGGELTEVLNIEDDVAPLTETLLRMGARVVLIKCGAPGIYYACADTPQAAALCADLGLDPDAWLGKRGFEQSFRASRVLSATGAGDTSIAAFLAAVLEQNSLARCMQLATASGACCVTAYDALSGLLPLNELEEKIDAGWEKEARKCL